MKEQIWYIGGGDSFSTNAEFFEHLRSVDLWHLDEKSAGTSWKKL